MRMDLRENIPHGTKEYPYVQYHLKNNPHRYQVPIHWHEQFEIIYVKNSTINLSIDDTPFHGKKGDIFLVNPEELHFIKTDTMESEFYTLLFPLDFISFRTDDALEENLNRPLRLGLLKYETKVSNKALIKDLHKVLQKLIEMDHNNAHNNFKTRIYLLELLQLLYEYKHPLKKISKKNETLLQKNLIDYIREKYTENISLKTISEEFHMSEKYLSRYFKEHFSMGYSEFLLHLRLSNSRELLEKTELPITDIALSSGFRNISYFIRSFHKQYGLSPLQYRKNL